MRSKIGEIEKATAFVTRRRQGKVQLLVFQHPLAGTQVPAGTVELDECPDLAVVREVLEETGLGACRLVGLLGTLVIDLPPDKRIVVLTEAPRALPGAEPAEGTRCLRRGLTVSLRGQRSGWSEVFAEEYDFAFTPPELISEYGGWVPSRALGGRIVRHMYHLDLLTETSDHWEHEADGFLFRPFWTFLEPPPELVAGQGEWLDFVYGTLQRSCAMLYGS